MSFLSDDSLIEQYSDAEDVFNKLLNQNSIYLSKRKSLKSVVTKCINDYLLIEEGANLEDICHISIEADELYAHISLFNRYKDKIYMDKIMNY